MTIFTITMNILFIILAIFYFSKATNYTVLFFYLIKKFQKNFNGYWVAFLTFLCGYIILCICNP